MAFAVGLFPDVAFADLETFPHGLRADGVGNPRPRLTSDRRVVEVRRRPAIGTLVRPLAIVSLPSRPVKRRGRAGIRDNVEKQFLTVPTLHHDGAVGRFREATAQSFTTTTAAVAVRLPHGQSGRAGAVLAIRIE